jgi:hypothetical protein
VDGWARNNAEHVEKIQEKLNSAERCLKVAKEQKCADIVEEFANIAGDIEDLLIQAKRKRARILS